MANVKIDASEFDAKANRYLNVIKARAERRGIQAVAEEILRLSGFEVPHDEGTLQNSGAIDNLGGSTYVGYHTPYAARLHEHPEYNFQKGRKGKYLEDPIKNNQNNLNTIFGIGFRKAAV